uniref:Ig-like domain-containing protein n=1 Tax=Seriola dumerili TaxID=41447 RepID=A0A3B4T3R8_SERDU
FLKILNLNNTLVAAVGETVMFTTTVLPQETPILVVTWSFLDISGISFNIITSSSVNISAPGYMDRITLFRSTGSLELRNLTLNDSGEYRLTIIPAASSQQKGSCRLVVHGMSMHRCYIEKQTENSLLPPMSIIVRSWVISSKNLQWKNINLTLSPSQEYYVEGSNISLSCSAVSRPAALYYWFLNGDLLSDTGPELRLMNIQISQSGNYSCQAFNNKTLRPQTAQLSALTVLGKLKLRGF